MHHEIEMEITHSFYAVDMGYYFTRACSCESTFAVGISATQREKTFYYTSIILIQFTNLKIPLLLFLRIGGEGSFTAAAIKSRRERERERPG